MRGWRSIPRRRRKRSSPTGTSSCSSRRTAPCAHPCGSPRACDPTCSRSRADRVTRRSEEHTSELQSQSNLVCRLLLEKKYSQPWLPRLVKERINLPSSTTADELDAKDSTRD